MSQNTKIEWADHTFNPWEGCQKVGPGCDHCYAEARNARFGGGVAVNWGPGAPRRRTSPHNWRSPVHWNAQHEWFHGLHGRRARVFCASLADVFDNAVDQSWREDLFDLILATPNLDWLLLTKRIGNVNGMLPITVNTFSDVYPNVWIGATVVNQEEADRDIPRLLQTPVAKRFLSMEPLLGPVDLRRIPMRDTCASECCGNWRVDVLNGAYFCGDAEPDGPKDFDGSEDGIDWVIVGGESGPNARPMHPDWARGLRDQCKDCKVPFLFKQWGEWTPGENVKPVRGTVDTAFWLTGDKWVIHPLNLATDGGHIDDQPDLYRVGKKTAGRHLDGRTWDEFPQSAGGRA